jgi:hypothetical protein
VANFQCAGSMKISHTAHTRGFHRNTSQWSLPRPHPTLWVSQVLSFRAVGHRCAKSSRPLQDERLALGEGLAELFVFVSFFFSRSPDCFKQHFSSAKSTAKTLLQRRADHAVALWNVFWRPYPSNVQVPDTC